MCILGWMFYSVFVAVLHLLPFGEATTTTLVYGRKKVLLGRVIFLSPLEGFTQTRTDTIAGSLLACDPVFGALLDFGNRE